MAGFFLTYVTADDDSDDGLSICGELTCKGISLSSCLIYACFAITHPRLAFNSENCIKSLLKQLYIHLNILLS